MRSAEVETRRGCTARYGCDDSVRRNLPQPGILVVGDKDIAIAVHGHTPRAIQLSVRGRATVAGKASRAVSGDGGNVAFRRHLADTAVRPLRDVQVSNGVHRDAVRHGDESVGGGTSISQVTAPIGSRGGADDAIEINFSNPVVQILGNKQIARGIDRQGRRPAQLGAGGRAAISRESGGTIARNGGDHTGRRHFANTGIAVVGDIEIAGSIDRHVLGSR